MYGESENKSKDSHSQFVIETKNYGLLNYKIDSIDFQQLKNYIISNKSKIRIICSTDYISMYVFNATEIKKQINVNILDKITASEINIFKKYLLYEIHFNKLKDRDTSDLKNLSYESVFAEHKFITPTDSEDLYSIQDSNNRKNFISNLFTLMKIIESDVKLDFNDILKNFFKEFNKLDNSISFKKSLITEITKEEFKVIKSFLIWGSEMNYIPDIITISTNTFSKDEASAFFNNVEYQEAFILTSVYNLINKTFFIRILEDSSTDSTSFIRGMKNKRYLSNGILQDKMNESEESLVQYLKDIYEFSKPDLRHFSFLLRKDIYSWVLDWIDKPNLISFIRLFNDISFKKLTQDILGDIYEHYLEQDKMEDSKSFRRLLGQYYTPKPIVRLMWFLVRDVLKETTKRDLYVKDKPYLDILDPAYGSGTFLYEYILQVNQSETNNKPIKDGKVYGFIKERNKDSKIEDHLFGFEINPLSKSIADVNLFFGLIQAYGINNIGAFPVQHLNIYRTNSFELGVNNADDIAAPLFSFIADDLKYSLEEKKEIADAKTKQYDIIIANPPYGPITPSEYMINDLIPFAYPENNFDQNSNEINFNQKSNNVKGNIPSHEKNRGKLKDLYAFFFGVADKLIKDNGIICFITSNTYFSAPSYIWLRKYFLKNYTIHYLVNFNKRSEKGNSMFAPEAGIGTSIIVMSKIKPKLEHKIKILDLSEIPSIVEKFNVIAKIKWSKNPKDKNDIMNFESYSVSSLKFKSIPQNNFLNTIDYIFSENELKFKIEINASKLDSFLLMKSGVNTGDDTIFVNKDKKIIQNNVTKNIVDSLDYNDVNITLRNELIQRAKRNKFGSFTESQLYPFLVEKDIDKHSLTPSAFIYYDPDILLRPGESQNILNPQKLIVHDNKSAYKVFSSVTDNEIIIPKQNDRIRYYLNEDADLLFAVCSILNSKVMEYYFKISFGARIFPIKNNLKNHKLYKKLVQLSKEIHDLTYDKNILNVSTVLFKSNWFKKNISPKIAIISILEGSDLWKLSYTNDMVHDYYVSNVKIDEERKHEIILNSETKIICKDNEVAQKLYNTYLKAYDGDLSEQEININLTEFTKPEKYSEIAKSIENKCLEIESEIDDLVFKIYDIDDNEKGIILNELKVEVKQS
jgi:hypothetical protein